MPFIESFSEFKARQGCECIALPREQGTLFANGARATMDPFGRGLQSFMDPPTERWSLLQSKRVFVAEKLRQWSKALEQFHNQIQEQLNDARSAPMYCPAPNEQNLKNLATLRGAVRDLEQELAKLDSELWESPEAVLQRERRRREQEVQDQIAQQRQKFNSIMDGYAPVTTSAFDPFKQAVAQENARLAATIGIIDAVTGKKSKK